MKRSPEGLTLVELMVALVILMIIFAISLPNYMRALQHTHEAAAVSYLRQVQTAQEAYRLSNQQYADTFAKLQPYLSAELTPPALPRPGLMNEFVSVAYAEPLPGGAGQGNSGSAPGQSGSTPGQSGSAPGQSGSTPGQSGSAPGQSGSTPGQSGSAPGQSGSTPGQSGSAPGQSGSTPGQSGSAPGQSGSTPGQSGSAPGQSGSTPGQSGSTPGQSGSTPSQGGGPASSGNASSGTGTGTALSDSKVYSKYIFELTLTDPLHWSCTASPVGDRLNSKFYYTNQSNIVHFTIGTLPDSLSPAIP
jgi:type II secretory pathway pseudopilin PulG